MELYQKGGRDDLVKQEQEEIADHLLPICPAQMSEDEVKAAIGAAIAETGAAGIKDMGKVIGVLRGKYAGQMDFGKASAHGEGNARRAERLSTGRKSCPAQKGGADAKGRDCGADVVISAGECTGVGPGVSGAHDPDHRSDCCRRHW